MSITLEDIKHLSVEVQSLVDARLPLESTLSEAGRGRGRQLQEFTEAISKRLQDGEPLEEIIRSREPGAPRMLAAAVAAGIRSGDLSRSVELLGDMADDLVQVRRSILSSLAYPLTIAAFACLLFVVFIRLFLSRVTALIDEHDFHASPIFRQAVELDREFWWWPILGLLLVAFGGLFWVISGRAQSMAFRGPERLLFLMPGVRPVVRDLQFYSLSRMLALMIDGQTPLTDSLVMAGPCTGNPDLDRACQRVAEQIQRGSIPSELGRRNWHSGELPPMLITCLRQTSLHERQFGDRLTGVAGYYRRRLQVGLSWLKHVVPVAMFVVIAGGTVLLYSLAVFWPVTEIFRAMAPN